MKTAPLMLSTTVSIAAGATANASTLDLTHPFREAMWIDSIAWTAVGSNAEILTAGNWGATLRTRLQMGRLELTRNRSNGFVPIWNFSSQVNQGGNTGAASNQIDTVTYLGSNTYSMTFHKWKLPRPLYLPPGMSLQSSFQRSADGIPGNLYVSVAYAGRYCDPKAPTQKTIAVPHVSFFEVPAGGNIYMSNNTDLVNPFQTPLHVQRFIARAIQTTGTDPVTSMIEVANDAQIKIQDSHGHNVVRDFLPFDGGVVFDYNRRGWTFNQILDPKQWYNMQIVPKDLGTKIGDPPVFEYAQQISMIGWREEALQ